MGFLKKVKKKAKKAKTAVHGASKAIEGVARTTSKISGKVNKLSKFTEGYTDGIPLVSTVNKAVTAASAAGMAQSDIIAAAADKAAQFTDSSGKSGTGQTKVSFTTTEYETTSGGLVPKVSSSGDTVDTTKNYLLFGLMAAVAVFMMKK